MNKPLSKCQFLFEHCCFKQNSSCFVGPVNGHEMFWTVLLTIMGFFVVFSSSWLVITVSLVLLWCARKQLSKCLKISFNLFLLLTFTWCWRGWSIEHEVFSFALWYTKLKWKCKGVIATFQAGKQLWNISRSSDGSCYKLKTDQCNNQFYLLR